MTSQGKQSTNSFLISAFREEQKLENHLAQFGHLMLEVIVDINYSNFTIIKDKELIYTIYFAEYLLINF